MSTTSNAARNKKNNKKKIAYVELSSKEMYESYWDGCTCSFIQKQKWWSCSCQIIAQGLEELGYEVRGFMKNELVSLVRNGKVTRNTPVRGSIRTIQNAFSLLGVPSPENVDIPKSLKPFTYRKLWKTTLGVVRRNKKEVFIKPLLVQKAFNGHVTFEKQTWNWSGPHENYETKKFANDLPLLASEVINMEDEFRSFILNGKIVATEASTKKERDFLKKLVKAYTDAPASYAIDICHIRRNKNSKKSQLALVEVNQGYSAGSTAGIRPVTYAKIHLARWFEIVGLPIPK